jgi:hypothetical protein
MREIEMWLRDLGLSGAMTHSARQNLDRFRDAKLSAERKWDLITLLDAAARHGVLAERQEGAIV